MSTNDAKHMKYRELYNKYFSIHLSQGSTEGTPEAYDYYRRWWRQGYIRRWLPEDRRARILEIGSGPGYHLHALNRLGYTDLRGIDLSPEMIEMARTNVPAVDFSLADAFSVLPQQPGRYDLIIMFHVIEHFTRDEAIELCRLAFDSLTSGGTMLVRTPNAANPLSLRGRYLDLTHETCYTENSLVDLFRLSGFRQVKIIGLRAYNSQDKLWKQFTKSAFLLPASLLYHGLLKLAYLAEGNFGGIVNRDILGIAVK